MGRITAQSSDALLARLNHEVEKISALQHRLARQKSLLQEYVTRLRLGASPTEVRLALKAAAGADRQPRGPWDTDRPVLSPRDRTDRKSRRYGEPSL
jgi:hypothetical protein